MPKGLLACRWDERLGVIVEGQYPKNVAEGIHEDDILSIFTTHTLSEAAGILSMKLGEFSTVSYYSKPKEKFGDHYVVALLLSENENPNDFEASLTETAKIVIDSIGKSDFNDLIAQFFESASKKVEVTLEQRYAYIYRDNTLYFVLKMLRDGPITKAEIEKRIIRELKQKVTDINEILSPLLRTNLITELQISEGKAISTEYIFLIRDMGVIRTPPLNALNLLKSSMFDPSIRQQYQKQVDNFFKQYKITPEDTSLIAELISNLNTYEIIKILRNQYLRKEELFVKLERDIGELDNTLSRLINANVIVQLTDNLHQNWIFLLSDVQALTIFPKYLLDVIEKGWNDRIFSSEVAIKHLDLLKAEYESTEVPKSNA